MWRLIERNVRSGLVIAWRLATSPTSTSPALENATTDGVVRAPSELGMTTGSPPSRTDDDRVGGTEVDADCLGHGVAPSWRMPGGGGVTGWWVERLVVSIPNDTTASI